MLSALLLIAAHPAQAQTETVLYNFCSQAGCTDGSRVPNEGGLTSYGGNFYGETEYGGLYGYGTVFELSPEPGGGCPSGSNSGNGWCETVLYSFNGGADGRYGYSSLLFDKAGNLYGVTYDGGANGAGVVFELSLVGDSWTETVLYSFCSQPGCADGQYPLTSLIMDAAGNIYGVTNQAGSVGDGTVFELSQSGGSWTEQVIYLIPTSAGGGTNAGLTMDSAGNIYGATWAAVFELSPNGSGGWNPPTVLHTFAGAPKDGRGGMGTPVFDKAGNLYGATIWGGAHGPCTEGFGCGTVYKLTPVTKGKKKGTWTEKILYSFKGGKKDADQPAGVALDEAGNIYGGSTFGGKYGDGIVFELVAPAGKGSIFKENVLLSFDGTDGATVYGPPIVEGGNLYGATGNGGSGGYGVVYELTP